MTKNFVHLRTLSSYSLSESTLKINKLVKLAKEKNMPALAITDNNNMFGVFEFAQECCKNQVQPIIGSSINLLDAISNEHSFLFAYSLIFLIVVSPIDLFGLLIILSKDKSSKG